MDKIFIGFIGLELGNGSNLQRREYIGERHRIRIRDDDRTTLIGSKKSLHKARSLLGFIISWIQFQKGIISRHNAMESILFQFERTKTSGITIRFHSASFHRQSSSVVDSPSTEAEGSTILIYLSNCVVVHRWTSL